MPSGAFGASFYTDIKKKKHRNRLIYGAFLLLLNVSLTVIKLFLAEREGFEPPVPLSTAVFKTAVIDHSTTFPTL